jgi:signal transduction histidine kinase
LADEVLAAGHPPPWWPPEAAERNDAERAKMFDGVASRVELTLRHADGRRFPVAVTTSSIAGAERSGRFIQMFHDLTDERRVAAELAAAHAEMEVADDRDRIARDLHDGVIQRLFAAGLRLQASADRPDMRERVLSVIDDLDVAIAEIRAAIFTLHRRREVASGMETEMRVVAAEAARMLGHEPTVTLTGDLRAVPPELAHEATTVVRELLSNVARHAGASTTWLDVAVVDDELTVRVDDDGVGIDPAQQDAGGDGLRNVRERARQWHGRAAIGRRAPAGTRVEWVVPLDLREPTTPS